MGVATRKRNKKKIRQKSKYAKDPRKRKINASHLDPRIRDLWDTRKTLQQNYAALGIATKFNDVHPLQDVANSVLSELNLETNEEIPWDEREVEEKKDETTTTIFDELFPKTEEIPNPPRISKDEIAYFKPLIKKYKDDYKAMAKDTKLNWMLYGAKMCKKKCDLYHEEQNKNINK